MTRKFFYALIFAILIANTCFAASNRELVFNLGADPRTIDPVLNNALDGCHVIANIFEGLVRLGVNNSPEPACAESWKFSDDGMTWTFKLRENLKWSDGKDLTAQDFKYGFTRILDPNVASPYAYYAYFIRNGENFYNGKVDADSLGLKAIDDRTLVIELDFKNPLMLEYLAFPIFMPARQDIIQENPRTWAARPETLISNGAFKLKNWKHGDGGEITLEKNDFYWEAPKVKLDRVRMVFINDENTALAAFKSGKIDYMSSIPSQMLPMLLKSGEAISLPSLGTAFCDFNITQAPFDNINVRKAFTLAIDRKAIVEKILLGGQKPAVGFVPYNVPGSGFEHDFRGEAGEFLPETADVKAARKFLADAGYPDGKNFPKVTYKYNSNTGNKMLAEVLQAMWKRNLGIEVELHNEEWKVFLETRNRKDYQIARGALILDFVDAANLLEFLTSTNPQNSTGYSNPDFDSLITAASSEMSHELRTQYLIEAEKILMSDLPVLPIYFYNSAVMKNPRVKNIIRTVTGNIYFRLAEVD